jgi:hypothetical protein
MQQAQLQGRNNARLDAAATRILEDDRPHSRGAIAWARAWLQQRRPLPDATGTPLSAAERRIARSL